MMGRKPRGLTDSDRAAWEAYAARIAPLPRRDGSARHAAAAHPSPPSALPPAQLSQPEAPAPAAILPPRPPPTAPRSPAAQAAHRPLAVGESPGGVDGASWQRLRGGKLVPERKLDLHGLTAQRAYHALVAFVRSAHADRLRCVEVITGRGSGDETGVLRRELPLWLNRPDIRPLVLAAAHPHAANVGAVRLLLRRVR
jgi:DNA-nicking Smr family endonuclease